MRISEPVANPLPAKARCAPAARSGSSGSRLLRAQPIDAAYEVGEAKDIRNSRTFKVVSPKVRS